MKLNRPPSVIMLLDIDGTLLDTDKHLSNAMKVLFGKYGVEFKPEEFFEFKTFPAPNKQGVMEEQTTMLFGATWEMVYYYLKSQNPDVAVSVTEFRAEVVDYVSSHHDDVVVRHDVIDEILRLRELCAQAGVGFTAIAVTNAARPEALVNLELVKTAGLTVDELISADDVTLRKPDPQPYMMGQQAGIELLDAQGFDTSDVLVMELEDSPPGSKSACAAACQYDGICYYIPTTKRKLLMPELTAEEAEHFVIQQDIATLGMEMRSLWEGRSDSARYARRLERLRSTP